MAMSNADLIAAISKGGGNPKAAMSDKDASALDFVLNQNADFQNTLDKEAQAKKLEVEKKAKAEALKKKKAEEKALKDSLGSNQFLMTKMTGGKLPESGINHVVTRYPEGTWDKEHEINIPEVNPHFHWDPEVLEDLLLSYDINTPCLAVGPPGTGKTSAGHQLCAWMRQPYARFNGKDGIEPAAFLGYMTIEDGDTKWRDGLMAQAVEHGYYLAIDEIFKLPPGIQMAMQSLYEKGGFLMLDEKPGTIKDKHIYPRPEFRILGTDNTKGTGDDLDKYPAGQMQDVSSIDRFGITTEVGYLTAPVERKMLSKQFPACDVGDISKAVAMAKLVRESFVNQGDLSLTMSPRGLMNVCELLQRKIGLAKALHMTYISKLGEDAEIRTAKKFVSDCI